MANVPATLRTRGAKAEPAPSPDDIAAESAKRQVRDGDSPRERVVRDVIRGLYDGRYKPGQRLVEAKITAAYGISRGPVREALNRLAAMGIVSLTLQRGGQVRELTIREAVDILVVVQSLVGIAGRLAAMRIGLPGASEKLREALSRLDAFDASSAGAEYAVARDHFYATLTQLADNAELRRILPGVQVHLIRVQFRDATQIIDRARHSDYHRIANAVLTGRQAEAETAVRAHFARTIKILEQMSGSGTSSNN